MLDVGPYMKALEVPAWVRPTLFWSQGLPGCPSLPGEDGVLGIPSAFMFSKLDAVFTALSPAHRLRWSLAPQLHWPLAPSRSFPAPLPGPRPRTPGLCPLALPACSAPLLRVLGSWIPVHLPRASACFSAAPQTPVCYLGSFPVPSSSFQGRAQLGSPLRPALGHCRLGACLPAIAGALGLLFTGGPETELGEGREEGRGSRNAEKCP